MKGLRYYFITPFVPIRAFTKLKTSISERIFWEALFLHFVILIGFNVLYFLNHPFHPSQQEIVSFIIGFLIGVIGRILVLAYLIKLAVNRVFKVKISFTECVNYGFITLFPLLTGLVYPFFSIQDFGTSLWLGIMYSSFLVSYGIHLNKNVDFVRMVVLIICCHLLLFVFRAPFLGFGFAF